MNQFGYIYRVTNLATGKIYIGQRMGEFDPFYYGSGTLIRRAVSKHGKESFIVEFIQSAFSRGDLDRLEIAFISEARSAGPTYNIRDGGIHGIEGGRGFMTGKSHSEETRRKMADSHRGPRNHFFGRGDLLSGVRNPRFGAKLTDETKRKIGEANQLIRGSDHGNFGKVRSAETRAKISAAKRGTPAWNKGRKNGVLPCA